VPTRSLTWDSDCSLHLCRSGGEGDANFQSWLSMPAFPAFLHRDGHNFALLSQSSAVEPEHYRYRDHDSGKAGEQSSSPLDTEVGEHLASKQRESSRNNRSKHDVGGYSRSGAVVLMVSLFVRSVFPICHEDLHRKVSIDQVVETRHEDAQHPGTGENTGRRWGHPVDRWVPSCPCKPVRSMSAAMPRVCYSLWRLTRRDRQRTLELR